MKSAYVIARECVQRFAQRWKMYEHFFVAS